MLGYLRRAAIRRGLMGGSRTWLILGGIAWGIRLIAWAWRRREKVVFLDELRTGESFVVTQRPAPSRRSRRS